MITDFNVINIKTRMDLYYYYEKLLNDNDENIEEKMSKAYDFMVESMAPYKDAFLDIDYEKITDMLELELLIDKGADVNLPDSYGTRVLMIAAATNNKILAQKAVEAGANINAADCSGSTALIYACQSNHADMAKYLLENGANVRKFDQGGLSAKMYAAFNFNDNLIDMLEKAEADQTLHLKEAVQAQPVDEKTRTLQALFNLTKQGRQHV